MGRRPALQARRAPGQAGGVRCGQGAVAQLRARAGRGGERLGRARPGDRGAPPRTSPPASPHLSSAPSSSVEPRPCRLPHPPIRPAVQLPSPAAQPSCPAQLPASAGCLLRGGPPLGGDALPALRVVQRVRALLRARPAQLRVRRHVARRHHARPPHTAQAALVGDQVHGHGGLLWRDGGGRRYDRQPPRAHTERHRAAGVAV